VSDWLAGQGWPDPLFADSGNGAHLLYRVDLPNDPAATDLMRNCLKALSFRFDDDMVKADTGNFNAARIWKLFGTKVCKGDDTPDRPHRMAQVIESPENFESVSLEKLQALAAKVPPNPERPHNGYHGNGSVFDLDQWIVDHDIPVMSQRGWQGGDKWVLERCVWNADHTDKSAFIVQFPNGAIAAGCHHNSCQGKGWSDFREVFEPGYRDRRENFGSTGGYQGEQGGYEEEPAEWEDPQPFDVVDVPPFPTDALPSSVAQLVNPMCKYFRKRALPIALADYLELD
jgi:hypothetical protein